MTNKLQPHEEHQAQAPATVKCAVLTVSDSRSPETDYGGRTVAYMLAQKGHAVVRRWIVPDDVGQIDEAIVDAMRDPDVDAMITTGGTGIAKRDVTYETVARRLTKRLDGFGEIFRYLSFKEIGTSAIMSRAIAGVAAGKVIIALPGSPAACELAMEKIVLPELAHMVQQAKK
jgi:molybdenum cofactor biosynthesis protein B